MTAQAYRLTSRGIALVEFAKDAHDNYGWPELQAFNIGNVLMSGLGDEVCLIDLWDRWNKLDEVEQSALKARYIKR